MPKRAGDPKAAVKAHEEKRAVVSLIQNRTLIALFKAVDEKYARKMRVANELKEREAAWAVLRGLDALYLEIKSRLDRGTAQEQRDQKQRNQP